MASDPAHPLPDDTAAQLVAEVSRLLAELHSGTAMAGPVTLASALDRDLGLDSLSRVELAARLETRFGVHIPEHLQAGAETVGDLLRALGAGPAEPAYARGVSAQPLAAGEAAGTPDHAVTLVEALEWHCEVQPERVHVRLWDDAGAGRTLDYGALRSGALRVAGGLAERGVEPGAVVAIMLPTGVEYLASFLGVLYAGAVPLPIYPPARASQLAEHLRRHAGILAGARAVALIGFAEAAAASAILARLAPTVRRVLDAAELDRAPALAGPVAVGAGALALLQYTSGSTGDPKGVMLTHANLLASLRAMGRALEVEPDDVFVSWLPLYHDMGLIGAWLGSLYFGLPLVLMSPLDFLARPVRWLRAIESHRATLSGGPNFAYELCVRRIADEEIEGLDLGSWRLAFNGAEPVDAGTLERFARRFTSCGLPSGALTPVFGLAEATLGVAFTPVGRGPRVLALDRERLAGGVAEEVAADASGAVRLVSSGVPIPGVEVRAVDGTGRELDDRREGRLQFRGAVATAGYYRNPEATRALHDGDWVETGDRGLLIDGEVYVSGRDKDLIIRAGRNLYPYELEQVVADVDGVRRGCVAAFGVTDSGGGERLVVVAETRLTGEDERAALRDRVIGATSERLAVAPDEVVLLPPHALLKTSSGKIRRSAMRDLHRRGRLSGGTFGRRLAVAGLALAAARGQLRRAAVAAAEIGWGIWAWTVVAVLGAGALVAVALPLAPRRRWAAVRWCARAAAIIGALPVDVRGAEGVPAERCVFASNHASYIDGALLMMALPAPASFVAKAELAADPLLGRVLARLGARFVERFDPGRAAADARSLTEALRQGGALAVFPEGTFRRAPGLRGFQLGAFAAAAEAGTPVVPVTLVGTRSVLRDRTWMPRRHRIRVIFGEPCHAAPADTMWSAAVGLRDAVRREILRRCAEPDLASVDGGGIGDLNDE